MSDGAQVLLVALTLLLPVSALIARRTPIGTIVKFALAWMAIFAAAAIVVVQVRRFTEGAPGEASIRSSGGVTDRYRSLT